MLRIRESNFAAVCCVKATSQQPIDTSQPNNSADMHTNGQKKILKRDWDVVRGFRRGVSLNIRNALDLEFFELLQHARYNYLKVLPREYITNLKTNHCPIDVNTIVELKAHYNKGW